VDVPGPAVDFLGQIASENLIYLVIGVVERGGWHSLLHRAVFRSGWKFPGQASQVMPTASERLVWGFGDGSTMPVFDTPLGRVGAVICWENYLPLMRAAMYAKGIEIYCAPTADARDSWGGFRAPYRGRRTLLCVVVQSIQPAAGFSRRLFHSVRRRSGIKW